MEWLVFLIIFGGYVPVIYRLNKRVSKLEDEIRELKK